MCRESRARDSSVGLIVDRTCRPQLLRDGQWRDLQVAPPGPFVALPVQLVVMGAAQRHRELVAHLAAQGSRLGKFQMVSVARGLPANEAGLLPDKQQVGLAALAGRLLRMGEPRLV